MSTTRIDFLAAELEAYQNAAYADRFRAAIAPLALGRPRTAGRATGASPEPPPRALYKAMAYKDEYEVARLYSDPAYRARLEAKFETPSRVRILLAPPRPHTDRSCHRTAGRSGRSARGSSRCSA